MIMAVNGIYSQRMKAFSLLHAIRWIFALLRGLYVYCSDALNLWLFMSHVNECVPELAVDMCAAYNRIRVGLCLAGLRIKNDDDNNKYNATQIHTHTPIRYHTEPQVIHTSIRHLSFSLCIYGYKCVQNLYLLSRKSVHISRG